MREKNFSKLIHSQNIPVLIHPHFLRSKQAGQIDLAILKPDVGLIFEIKGARGASKFQYRRLVCAALLLGEIFDRSFLIKTVCFKPNSAIDFDIT